MDIYTLEPSTFLRDKVVDGFNSAIWTERYSDDGEMSITLPATSSNRVLLSEGTLLGLGGSKEVMEIQTAQVKGNILTISGPSLLDILNDRVFVSAQVPLPTGMRVPANSIGEAIAQIVKNVIPGLGISTALPDDTYNDIINLSLGTVDTSVVQGTAIFPVSGSAGPTRRETSEAVSFGAMLPELLKLAQSASLGLTLYLESAQPSGYSLKFSVYSGRDRTSDQSVNDLVRFTPNLDTLDNIEELHSIKGYKNVAYAWITTAADPPRVELNNSYGPQVAYAQGVTYAVSGVARRALLVPVSDIRQEDLALITAAQLEAVILQRAKDALANNNYTKVVDGEVVPQGQYQFGTHYNLGDLVELESTSGELSKARITEYIRSQDATGERSYPTVSVI